MMRSLNVFLIHSPNAKFRENTMNTTCKIIETSCQKHDYRFRIFKITSHEPSELKNKTQELEKIINYEKTGDEEFDRFIQTLNLEQMSNLLKQKEALKQIVNLSKLPTMTSNDLFMIMEDDAMILPEFQKNLDAFLVNLDTSSWDVLMLSVSLPNQPETGTNKLIDIRKHTKILPGKEAYLIQPKAAEELQRYLETIRMAFRYQFSYWLHINAQIRIKSPQHRITLEGSKVGFMPSTTMENNMLIYNQEFMEMFKMMINQIPYDFQKIKQYYRVVEHLKSPDAMHLYGVILHREGKMEQAKDMFISAANEMQLKNGIVSARSELLNNAINIHGIVQEDLDKYTKLPSKYKNVVF